MQNTILPVATKNPLLVKAILQGVSVASLQKALLAARAANRKAIVRNGMYYGSNNQA